MKRLNNLYQKIMSIDNLMLADKKASKGKSWQPGVIEHNKNREQNILKLHEMLRDKTYKTSTYTIFKVYEPKEREVYRLPYYPDRILHHAIMNILEPVLVPIFTTDTYSCIKGKGTLAASLALRKALKNKPGTQYCLKLDIKKFYPNVDHEILKQLLRRKLKDTDLLWLLDEIIDSAPGLPIGNYLSQLFANFYVTYFDHWIKERLLWMDYFRYMDDMIFLSDNKPKLHQLLSDIREYLSINLKLTIKGNHQIFPVAATGISFVGYEHYHEYVLLRKTIKQNFARKLAKKRNPATIAAYRGWLMYCNGNHLRKKLLHETV